MRCDASREAMGVAWYQRDSNGFLQPIEFKSKAFAEPQKRLPAHDREALALLYALKSFRHFLLRRRFEVQTDNAALSQIFTSNNLSDLYSRWYHKITEFEYIAIKHRPGRKLYCADALSRRRAGDGDENSPFFVQPGQLFKAAAAVHKVGTWRARTAVSASSQSKHLDSESCLHDSGRWSMLLEQSRMHQFSLKVTDMTDASPLATVQDPTSICGDSAAYQSYYIESEEDFEN